MKWDCAANPPLLATEGVTLIVTNIVPGLPTEITDSGQPSTIRAAWKALGLLVRPVLVDFWAPWCGPCLAAKPAFKALAADLGDKVVFASVNVDLTPKLPGVSGVEGIPCFILFQGGKEIARHDGWSGKAALRKFIESEIARGWVTPTKKVAKRKPPTKKVAKRKPAKKGDARGSR